MTSPSPAPSAATARAAQAARMRTYRHRSGHTRSTLVELAALGRFLETCTQRQVAAFIDLVGPDVTRRALWAAGLDDPSVERYVAG